MIPKIIHYCWFGRREKPKLVEKCIESWKRYCSDYEILEWNEDNFDITQNCYLQWCYENRKWAFLSDYARLLVIKEYGGVYLDVDVELIRSLDNLLTFDAFYCFETNLFINTGLGFGCIPEHPTVKAMAEEYRNLIPNEAGDYSVKTCPRLNTQALLPLGLIQNGERQTVMGAEILPADFLNPLDDGTGRLHITDNTYSIHWYGKSWMNKGTILKSRLMRPLHRILGPDFFVFKIMRGYR